MKTIELLAVTQSVKGGKDRLSPYKMSGEKLLPKFGSADKAATAAEEPVAAQPAAQAPVKPRRFSGPAVTLRQALSKKNPFATAKPERLPVQTELRLEQVKVVRNDLNDSDLELVAASTAKKAEEKPMVTPEPSRSFAGTVWSRLTARLFNIGRAWL